MWESVRVLENHISVETRAALRSFLGKEEANRVWYAACHACQLEGDGARLSLADLDAIAQHLKTQQGVVVVVGHSLSIQVRTYQMLARAQRLDDFLKEGTP